MFLIPCDLYISAFLPCGQCSQEWLQIHHSPDQNKAFTEDEWINEQKCHQILRSVKATCFQFDLNQGTVTDIAKDWLCVWSLYHFCARFKELESIVLLGKKMNNDSVWDLSTAKCLGNRYPKVQSAISPSTALCVFVLCQVGTLVYIYKSFSTWTTILLPKLTNVRAQIN